MKIAVVILNWNGKELLEKFLPSITKYSNNAEIIIADNASTDDSIEFVKEHYPSVTIIINKENGGYARGYNEALKHVKADVFALVNSDIEVTKGWLDEIPNVFKDGDITFIQPKILDYKNKTKFEFAGATGGFVDKLGYPYCRGRVFTEIEEDKGQHDTKMDIFWASGACFFVKSDAFRQLGGFDEDYFAHMEEIDLCWRAHNLKMRVVYEPSSVVYHVGGATLKETNPHKTYLNFRNSLFTLLKNTPKRSVVFLIFARLILDGVAGAKFLMEGNGAHTLAILKSHHSFYKGIHKTLKKRQYIKNKTNNYYIHKSIVFQFYVLKRKVFNNLK